MNQLIKRVLVGFVGGLVTLIGVVALIAPGPGWLIIFTGLGILASEFAWAARVLTSARGVANRAANAAKIKKKHRLMIMAVLIFLSLVSLVIWYEYAR
ncbi:MAG: PGPGW domain-containing protein [Candidatus Nanopelagicus sp.]